MYKVKLQDGAVLDNLSLNGNNFIPDITIDKAIFENNLDEVFIINSDGSIEEVNNAKVVFSKVGNKESFILLEKTKEEIEKETLEQLIADLTEIVLLGGM